MSQTGQQLTGAEIYKTHSPHRRGKTATRCTADTVDEEIEEARMFAEFKKLGASAAEIARMLAQARGETEARCRKCLLRERRPMGQSKRRK